MLFFRLSSRTIMFWTSLLLFISMAGAIGPSVFLTIQQMLNSLMIEITMLFEDENDPCPDNPDTQCSTPETPADLPGINAPIDQGQEQDGGEQGMWRGAGMYRRRAGHVGNI